MPKFFFQCSSQGQGVTFEAKAKAIGRETKAKAPRGQYHAGLEDYITGCLRGAI